MELSQILAKYFNQEDKSFSDLFIQMFVNSDNSFAFTDFNRVHETNFTYKQIIAGLKDLTGRKYVEYSTPEMNPKLWKEFTTEYKFGVYKVAKDWNLFLADKFGEVLPRGQLLGWIAKQHPPKSQGSFLPTHDGNLYAKEEKSVSRTVTTD